MSKDLPLRSLAHIGDALWEVFIRKKTIYLTSKADKLHKLTVKLVNGQYQADLLAKIDEHLTEEEKDIARRARNLKVTTKRRTDHNIHRLSTAFEALIGYLELENKKRLEELFGILENIVDTTIDNENKS